MMIHASGATLNVTYVDKIICDRDSETGKWFCLIVYENGKGELTTYKWAGANSPDHAMVVHKELLKQIKEVELEKMSTLMENAIREA